MRSYDHQSTVQTFSAEVQYMRVTISNMNMSGVSASHRNVIWRNWLLYNHDMGAKGCTVHHIIIAGCDRVYTHIEGIPCTYVTFHQEDA